MGRAQILRTLIGYSQPRNSKGSHAQFRKSIIGAYINVKPSLSKLEPTNKAELLRQPIFGNPLIINHESKPLGLSDKSEGNAFASSSCSKVTDLWDPEE
jgi:hypothetical protein